MLFRNMREISADENSILQARIITVCPYDLPLKILGLRNFYMDGDQLDCKEIREMYKLMFAEYPDIVTVKDLQAMLGISRHAAYDLLGEGEISCIRLGNAYKIPKINVINYVLKSPCGQTRVSA